MPGFSLIDFDGLSKPGTLLIEKISNALGRHFDPSQTARMALAEAEANRIRTMSEAETEIEVNALRSRAAARFINEEMTNQANIESVVQKAIPHLNDNTAPEDIEDDWITNHLDRCRIVSDGEMQEIWARILAGQANNPGSFSRKTVNLMADLDKRDAELFMNLCRFRWGVNHEVRPLVFDVRHDIYNRCGINFASLRQLEALGLAHFDDLSGFVILDLPQKVPTIYHNRSLSLTFPSDSEVNLNIGKVLFTQYGSELSRVVRTNFIEGFFEGFFEYVCDQWASYSPTPQGSTLGN